MNDEQITIGSVKRLDVRPGDSIILTIGRPMTLQQIDELRREWIRNFPGHKLAIVGPDIEVSVLTGPPAGFWRDIPCGHPPDPVAWLAPDGQAVCHCGLQLDRASGIALEAIDAGVVVHCSSGCGCHVLIPVGDET